jgi:hypothetical protein
MNFCWKVLIEVSFLLLIVNGFFIFYDWPEELLAAVNWAGAIALIGLVYFRGARRARVSEYVGTYRQEEVPA